MQFNRSALVFGADRPSSVLIAHSVLPPFPAREHSAPLEKFINFVATCGLNQFDGQVHRH
jgi:hypothetical protein